jgi:DNA-binding NarL/FixJ family response regulator
VVTILIFDRQSLCQASISTRLRLLLQDSTLVADCATEAELVLHITDNPGATLFLGQISLRSEAMQLARQLSCPVVWIAEPKDEYLPLLAQPAIRGIMFRTAKAADLAECIAALRERRMWIQQLDNPDDATSSQQEKWGLLTQKQRQLTALLLEGMQCKEIAAQRGTTCQVIKNSVVLIYAKLGVKNRYDLLKALLEFPPTCERASIKPRARKR